MIDQARKSKFGSNPEFTLAQEIANAVTHGTGAVLAIAGLVVLVVAAASRGTVWHVVSYAVFGASMVLLYMASTLYHAFQKPRVKKVLEKFDHAAIFVLIAGTYTAFALTILRSSVGWWLFGAVWGMAAFGIVMEAVFINRWPWLTLGIYLAMGWLIVLVWGPFMASASSLVRMLIIAGGLSYTVGTVFYGLGRRHGWFHPGWHLFVIGGTICHFFSVMAALPH
ncbi:MAG: hemolysin III family protein [Spirochaetota bacterium]